MRKIFLSRAFSVRLKKFLRYHSELENNINRTLKLLIENVHDVNLKTHKLHGKMNTSYACSINYNYRIIFSFDNNCIYLESIGSHEDVY
jgi:addiction module RelE/StbE family toxin